MFNNKVYHKIDALSGSVATLRAEGVKYNEIAQVESRAGVSLAQVIKLDGENVTLQIFAGARGVDTSAKVRFLGETMKVPFSDALLGRAFTGAGVPRDGGPAIDENPSPIGQPSVNPARRIMPNEMVRTNIPMIDLFNSLVKSQKLPIFARAGEPYNELLSRIALQADSDVIIIGGMGLKYDEYLKFRSTLDESGALSKTVMFVHTAADPTVECMLVPDVSLAVAEKFALQGKDVLVLLTDMTSFADAMKEIAITMEQIPSNRGYPGDLYSQLASRYEKAVDFDGAGSITILAVTTMPGDDVTHPVPDNTGYITEGQFYLKNGRIEPFGSLSRLKQQVNKSTREDHRTVMDAMIKLYAQYKEALEKQAMGFKMSDWDMKLLKYGADFEKSMMDLSVNIPLEDALDLGWKILADNFERSEVGIPTKLSDKFWPKTA
jgi:V/A-type H+-transporting ATPase subunit B